MPESSKPLPADARNAPAGDEYRARLDRVLPMVQAPGQYVGGEINAVRPDPDHPPRLRAALAYPDLYSVGMSHLGLRILYDLANRLPGVFGERVFAPAPDFEKELREQGLPLATLESATPLAQCDLIGFSLSYELGVTGVLTILAAGGLPQTRAERDADRAAGRGPWPLVVAGGHAAHAPEPFADFIDAFFVGEAEESFAEALALYRDAGGMGALADAGDFDAFLRRLATEVAGVYVPALYTAEAGPGGFVYVNSPPVAPEAGTKADAAPPFPVRRRVVERLDDFPPPGAPVVPTAETAHERVVVEIMRGCPNGCRFCQAGFITRPPRARSPQTIQNAVRAGIAATGFDEIGLLCLSASDHPRLAEIADALDREFAPRGIGLSLPSLRVDSALSGLIPRLRSVRPTGLTVAPEAGTERLRRVINKNVDDATLLEAARRAYASGFSAIKLYFMVGLPTETDEDVAAIATLANAVARCRDEARAQRGHGPSRGGRGGKIAVNVSVSNFVPKAHTPFEGEAALTPSEWERRHRIVADGIDRRRVELATHDPRVSLLEAALARGDRRLGRVALRAWEKGARLDAWSEHFRPAAWAEAFAEAGLSAEVFAGAVFPAGARRPWDHIDNGLSAGFLEAERVRAKAGERTAACGRGRCAGCGAKDCAWANAGGEK